MKELRITVHIPNDANTFRLHMDWINYRMNRDLSELFERVLGITLIGAILLDWPDGTFKPADCLPPGLTRDEATGEVSGIPTEAGIFGNFTIEPAELPVHLL